MADAPRIPVFADTREQDPLPLDPARFEVVRATLATGDYTLAGMRDVFAVERKSIGDLVNTVVHDWLRFRKELYRLAAMDFGCLLVECDPSDVWARRYESEAEPLAVMQRVNGIMLDHGVQVIFAGRRPLSVRHAEGLLALAWKKAGNR